MKLTSLHLQNIRSYDRLDIDFNQGTTLFEGDIGSGKSTLLMAIEFALFGLGNMKGNSLLRTGEKEGIVRLKLIVNGEEYEVQRKIVRSHKTAKQSSDGSYIKTKEGKLPLSPSEMKAKILEILNFNEPPNPRAKSVIFTYAVFTPQEEMKSILMDNPERRLQTLRKAFRIEDYKIAVENTSTVTTEIKNKVSELKGATAGLKEDIGKKNKLESEVKEEEKKIPPLDEKMKAEIGKREKIQATLRENREQHVKLSELVGQIPVIQSRITDSEGQVGKLKRRIEGNEAKISQLEPKQSELEKVKKPSDKDIKTVESEIGELTEQEKNLRKNEGALESKISDYSAVKEKGVCPTCDRPANPDEFTEKINAITLQKTQVSQKVTDIGSKIKEKRDLIKKIQEYTHAQEQLGELKDQLKQLSESLSEDKKSKTKLESQIKEDNAFVEKAQKEYLKLKAIEANIADLVEKEKEKETLVTSLQTSIAQIKERITGLHRSIADVKKIIENKRAKKKQGEELSEYVLWLRDYFIPTLQTIEMNVMASINEEFNEKFRQWFSVLVEDSTKDARIDEDFTPIIEQDGYDQDIQYLSGGEKTSVALAYRLSLNSMVQKVSTGIQSNLLILDEPTDGFSREQLFKVRDILNELRCPQVILVSHEKELESFADHIYKIVKTNGVSKIVA